MTTKHQIVISMKRLSKEFLLRLPGGRRVLDLYRSKRFYRLVGTTSRQGIFTRYYESNRWGNAESVSGPGSTVAYTENIRKEIPVWIDRLGVKRVLDAPCGDYNWFRLITRAPEVSYVGGDIVPALIDSNQARYRSGNTSFRLLDIINDPLPEADLWLCRDALFHFSERDIFRTLANFLDSRVRYLLTSSHTECRQNTDIPTGSFRQLNLELPPYSFCKPIAYIDDWVEGYPVRRLCLWDRADLRYCLESNAAIMKLRSTTHD
jgi:hypothetical protein